MSAPIFWIEVEIPVDRLLANVIGEAAKSLHMAATFDFKFHKAFVFQYPRGYYDWALYQSSRGLIVATLTALPDHRVRVDYLGGRPSEILYL